MVGLYFEEVGEDDAVARGADAVALVDDGEPGLVELVLKPLQMVPAWHYKLVEYLYREVRELGIAFHDCDQYTGRRRHVDEVRFESVDFLDALAFARACGTDDVHDAAGLEQHVGREHDVGALLLQVQVAEVAFEINPAGVVATSELFQLPFDLVERQSSEVVGWDLVDIVGEHFVALVVEALLHLLVAHDHVARLLVRLLVEHVL